MVRLKLMLTKQDLDQIRKVVKEEVNSAIEEFAVSLAPTFTNIFERFDKIEVRLDKIEAEIKTLKEEVNDLGAQVDAIERRINALYSRGNRHGERIKRVEKTLHLPAFA